MRFFKPEIEMERVKTWFAFVPVRIGRETRWLERVTCLQRYTDLMSPSGEPEPSWRNIKFKSPIVELTLKEVAYELGVDVENLRIKLS